MYGEPKDVDGECNARIFVGDDYGDNVSSFRCPLPTGHEGRHQEEFRGGTAVLTWEKDERVRCDHCGQWEHDHDYDNCPQSQLEHDYKTCPICAKKFKGDD